MFYINYIYLIVLVIINYTNTFDSFVWENVLPKYWTYDDTCTWKQCRPNTSNRFIWFFILDFIWFTHVNVGQKTHNFVSIRLSISYVTLCPFILDLTWWRHASSVPMPHRWGITLTCSRMRNYIIDCGHCLVSFHVLFSCHGHISLCWKIIVMCYLMCHFVPTCYYTVQEDSYYYYFMCCFIVVRY
jgi:hypothetical protein